MLPEQDYQVEIMRLQTELVHANCELTELRAKLAEQEQRGQENESAFRLIARFLDNPTLIADSDSSLEMELAKLIIKRAEAAEAEVVALRERERWIPVEEKLPVFRIPVQVAGGVAELRIDGWWTYMESPKRRIEWKVTHWKALSAAPER